MKSTDRDVITIKKIDTFYSCTNNWIPTTLMAMGLQDDKIKCLLFLIRSVTNLLCANLFIRCNFVLTGHN